MSDRTTARLHLIALMFVGLVLMNNALSAGSDRNRVFPAVMAAVLFGAAAWRMRQYRQKFRAAR